MLYKDEIWLLDEGRNTLMQTEKEHFPSSPYPQHFSIQTVYWFWGCYDSNMPGPVTAGE